MTHVSMYYPIFGPETLCPHCRQVMPALTLTDTYLCKRHGAFEADPNTEELVHLQSGRHWRLWDGQWYRQHTHPDGIRFEIHEALDRLYTEGYRATKVIIAPRYRTLINSFPEHSPWPDQTSSGHPCLYGLPVEFGPDPKQDPRWQVINYQDRLLRTMQYFHGSKDAARLYLRSMALIWNFHPYGQRTVSKDPERCSPFKDLNGFQYHDNWLQNLLIAGSMNGYRQ